MSNQIFLSYKNEDRERIIPIVRAIEREGWSVWWDRKIPPGRSFDEVIEEKIDKAKCIIVIWSEKSVASKWVKTEASEGERRRILIPVMIDDVVIPLAFRRIEAAQLIDWDGISSHPELDNIFEAIIRLVAEHTDKEAVKPEVKEVDKKIQNIEETNNSLEQKKPKPRFSLKMKLGVSILSALIIITLSQIIYPNWFLKKPHQPVDDNILWHDANHGTYTDQRDERRYKVIIIGKLLWFGENLAHMPHVGTISDNEAGIWVYGFDDTKTDEARKNSNYDIFGCLYNGFTAINICPDGWRLPSDENWKQLENEMGMTVEDFDDDKWRGDIANKLKSRDFWNEDPGQLGESGFDALPAGFRVIDNDGRGEYLQIHNEAKFWSCEPQEQPEEDKAWTRGIQKHNNGVLRLVESIEWGLSVRCVRDVINRK